MRRELDFVLSHRPYAVDMGGLRIDREPLMMNGEQVTESIRGTLNAAWFRRRRGVTVACIGYLWDHQKPEPISALEFLERHTDGRYGGNTCGRWNGSDYWGDGNLKIQAEYLAILRPMLENFPAVPSGYDGWWTFKEK